MSHKSQLLEQYIGKTVKITFKPYTGVSKSLVGVLKHNSIGFRPYVLHTKEFDYVFVKTEVKKVEEIYG